MERKRSVRRRQKKPFAERAKEHCRQFTAFMFSNVGIIILVVLYMLAGASMFKLIEEETANDKWADMSRNRNTFAYQLWNLSSVQLNGKDRSTFDYEFNKTLVNYQKQIVDAVRGGWPGNDERVQWGLERAFLYSLTVITTIGYGNICTRTEIGKVATIVYAMIGMPLFLLYLSNIGDILAKSFKWIYAKVFLCRICPGVAKRRALRERRKIRALAQNNINERDYHIEEALENISTISSISQRSDEDLEDDIVEDIEGATNTVTVPITICLMIMTGYILMGSLIFCMWEGWDFFDGCYFCFISLSSIGFGDIVPGKKVLSQNSDKFEWRFIVCAIYLLLGMALIAMCFNLMQEQVIYKIRAVKRSIRRCFRCDR
ncbi:TWiK family of potassium channels protein 18 [Bradysia coprophila]|uniref:TWiK family of potassium channels protein 18 n=1 Tax=Bradysia coprophila TaxID=38358 RepID=UPI00187D9108|nr:TWiK family of potassium channels protein 18 [Bradysia coprophila]